MASLFESTNNTRKLVKDSMRFIRSDVPYRITDKEIEWLIQNDVRLIVDLREESERVSKECPLAKISGFDYICFPVTGGADVPKTPNDVAKSYIKMADDKMRRMIDVILNADSNVMYFCNAGKDRTGVVSALLLLRLGESREYIINDYLESAENLKGVLEEYLKSNPGVDGDVITPRRRYMEEFLDNVAHN